MLRALLLFAVVALVCGSPLTFQDLAELVPVKSQALSTTQVSYTNSGSGKCQTPSGGDPAHEYYGGIGKAACESRCSTESDCHGYSVSSWGNCLLWKEFIVGGGASWSGATCVVKDLSYKQLGQGKCVTADGKDAKHSYSHAIGQSACKGKCDADAACYGYSVSVYDNCLTWLEYVKGGGASWGDAGCAAKPTYFKDLGSGKCLTPAGKDPKHSYHGTVDQAGCKNLCDNDVSCAGFSASSFGNCLLWKETVKGGGAAWGGARCTIKVPKFVIKADAADWWSTLSGFLGL